jgi:hypothetical protein
MRTKDEIAEIARRNGRKSKGPKTAEGKARVGKNNLKNGSRSKVYTHFVIAHSAVLCNEDRQAFYRILEDFVAELKPMSPVALGFVRAIAEDQWKINRLDALETATLTREIQRKIDSFVPIFPELGDALQTLDAADAIAARPAVINLIRRLRREYRASRRDNYNLLVDFLKRFPAPAERPQSIEGERNWAARGNQANSDGQSDGQSNGQSNGQSDGQSDGQSNGQPDGQTDGQTQHGKHPKAA